MCGDSGHREIIAKYCDNIMQVLNKRMIWKTREFQSESSKVKWISKVIFFKESS